MSVFKKTDNVQLMVEKQLTVGLFSKKTVNRRVKMPKTHLQKRSAPPFFPKYFWYGYGLHNLPRIINRLRALFSQNNTILEAEDAEKMYPNKKIRIFVRNKARYNPASKEYGFLHVDVVNYAGTTIKHIKENVKKQCRNSLKLDDLFLNNEKLSDERSVAHYNLEDGTVLEATSNPFWVSCLFIKQYEVEKTRKDNPHDPAIQKWTTKSFNRKKTLLSVLLNSKNEFLGQPPHFPTLNDFVHYLERLNKKGARMNPLYTQRDLQQMHDDYTSNFVGRSNDPLGDFIQKHANRLGLGESESRRPQNVVDHDVQKIGRNDVAQGRNVQIPTIHNLQRRKNHGGRMKKGRLCEDCEEGEADVYCPECQNATGGQGLLLCQTCSSTVHKGAARRSHRLQDIDSAPKASKPYTPHAFKAPFSILVALYSGMTETQPILSMTEDEVKEKAQPLTDTDLSDKQNGRYVGGFECMENCLMPKHFVQREDSANPTYALTDLGHQLARKLFQFQQSVQRFLKSHDFPQIPQNTSTVCGTRKLCLIIDEQERDRERFLHLADQWGIDAQVRSLPVGDYIWILTPPLQGLDVKYTQRQPALEKVLPFIVERKGWEDLEDSVRSKRFHKQILKMLGSGIEYCFYLLEGSISSLRYRTEQQQQKLKDEIGNIFMKNGFYINYTASWYKTVIWLKWFTNLLSSAVNKGMFKHQCQMYTEFTRRANIQPKSTVIPQTDTRKTRYTVWPAEQFIDNIFRDSRGLQKITDSVKDELAVPKDKQILIIQGLESYNKRRQTLQNKCLEETCSAPDDTEDLVNDRFSTNTYSMVHYDIMCHRQLEIQIFTQVYIVRTENNQDTTKLREQINRDVIMGHPANINTVEFHTQQTMTSACVPENKTEKENGDSQDEDLKRALDLSRHCTYNLELDQSRSGETIFPKQSTLSTSADVLDVKELDSLVPGHNVQSDSQDEELQRALELSRQSSNTIQNVFNNDSQDEVLQQVLELSRHEHADDNMSRNNHSSMIDLDDMVLKSNSHDEEFYHVLQLSRLDQSINDRIFERKGVLNKILNASDRQNDEPEKALELSCKEQFLSAHAHENYSSHQKKISCDLKMSADGARELKSALTPTKYRLNIEESTVDKLNNLESFSEEEQLRIAIEQSKTEQVKSGINLNVGEVVENSDSPVIVFDSQGTDYEDNARGCSQQSCFDSYYVTLLDSQGVEYEEGSYPLQTSDSGESSCDTVKALVEIQNQNFRESQFKPEDLCNAVNNTNIVREPDNERAQNKKTYSYDYIVRNATDVDKESSQLKRMHSDNNIVIEPGKERPQNKKTYLDDITVRDEIKSDQETSQNKTTYSVVVKKNSDVQNLNGFWDITKIDKHCAKEVGNVLVEDSQTDHYKEEDFSSENVTVPGTLGYHEDHEGSDNDDIDVIPPSPEKMSTLPSGRIFMDGHSKHIQNLTMTGLSCNRNVDGKDTERAVSSKETHSVRLLDCDTALKQEHNDSETFSQKKDCVFDVLTTENNHLMKSVNVQTNNNLCQGKVCVTNDNVKVEIQPPSTLFLKEKKPCDLKELQPKVEVSDLCCKVEKNEPVVLFTEMKTLKDLCDTNNKIKLEANNNSIGQLFENDMSQNVLESTQLEMNDEEYARMLQDQINKELECKGEIKKRQTKCRISNDEVDKNDFHRLYSTKDKQCLISMKKSQEECINDEEIARRLQEELDQEDNSPVNYEKRKLRKRKHDDISVRAMDTGSEAVVTLDEVISQHDVEQSILEKLRREKEDRELAQRLQNISEDHDEVPESMASLVDVDRLLYKDKDDRLVHHRSEQEKETEEHSHKLEEENEKVDSKCTGMAVGTQLSQGSTTGYNTQTTMEKIWDRKLKAIERSKTNLQFQLQEVRQSQNALYRNQTITKTPSSKHSSASQKTSTVCTQIKGTANCPSWPRLHPTMSPSGSFTRGTAASISTQHLKGDGKQRFEDDVITISPPTSPVEKKPNLSSSSSVYGNSNTGSSSPWKWSSDPSCENESSQISGNMSNATCGNCKQKGHNRKWPQCPSYHSMEETERRQKLELEAKKRIEERVNQEKQTRDELERHKNNLELIAAQIEQEKNGLDKTIKKLEKKGKRRK